MKNFSKNIVLWIVIGLLLIALFNLFQNSSSRTSSKEISFSDFLIAAENGNISEVKIVGNNVSGFFDDVYFYFSTIGEKHSFLWKTP